MQDKAKIELSLNFSSGRGDMKSGGASAPSAGGSSLAIAERQKPAPSCVAALFQMFARRKLFSSSSKKSKLLPPGEIATKLHCPCCCCAQINFPPSRNFATRRCSSPCVFGVSVRAPKYTPGRPAGSGEKTAAAKMRPLLVRHKISSFFFYIRFFLGMKLQFCSENVMNCP